MASCQCTRPAHAHTHTLYSHRNRRLFRRPMSVAAASTRTAEIMQGIDDKQKETGGAGGATTYQSMKRLDERWQQLLFAKDGELPAPEMVKVPPDSERSTRDPEYDCVICGGTLGVIIAVALLQKGVKKVAVVEQFDLQGRQQEWNISRKELRKLVELGVLTEQEMESVIASEFNPIRCGFHQGTQVHVNDVLNIGVNPVELISLVRTRFEQMGGSLLERHSLRSVSLEQQACSLQLGSPGGESRTVNTRLLLDCMGHNSPIMRQQRRGKKPEGACLVVGSCSRGFDPDWNTFGDLIYSCTDYMPSLRAQPFWEAFPAGTGNGKDRTTYMFTYLDPNDTKCPSLESMLEEYWRLMPHYQDKALDDLEVLRVPFGFFPTWRNSPVKPEFDRILQVGDASGIQSPLSFGGFGALTRHLERVSTGIVEALEADAISARELSLINAYQPNISAAWLFQRAMSVAAGQELPTASRVNDILSLNFQVMREMGDDVLMPFLQDVPQFYPLLRTIAGMAARKPTFTLEMTAQLGVGNVASWLPDFAAMGVYDASHRALSGALSSFAQSPLVNDKLKYGTRRVLQAWEFGSGHDYEVDGTQLLQA